jgi:sugar/nucleoside kinase (ribokinase family)
MAEFDVLAAGDLNVDLLLSGCPAPEPGKERLAAGMNYTLGGSAAIFACNLAALGARVCFAAKVGRDAPGEFCLDQLRACGVDVSGVRLSDEHRTGVSVILAVEGQAQKAILTYRGAMERLEEADIPNELLRRARHLHVAAFYLLPALQPGCARLFERARACGLTTSLDTNDDPDERWNSNLLEVLKFTDIFFPNRREALSIAGESDLCRAARKLARIGLAGCGRTVVAKADADGAVLAGAVSGSRPELRVPRADVEFVEATGAGDSFDAGFLFRYLAGAPPEDCLRFANACGALAVTAVGGTEAFHRPDLHAKLQEVERGR